MTRTYGTINGTQQAVGSTAKRSITLCPSIGNINAGYFCSHMKLSRVLPILGWITEYNTDDLLRDVIAGVTVGLTAIPQGIAYAIVAGLPPQYGLYASIMPSLIYAALGTSKDAVIGPTAVMSLMTQPTVSAFGIEYSVLLAFLAGCIILLLGVLHLGFLVEFISLPVTAGFTSAAAITIASSQVRSFLGLKGKSTGVIECWKDVFNNIDKIRFTDTFLGVITVVILLISRYIKNKAAAVQSTTRSKRSVVKTFWLLGLSGNVIVVVLGSVIAYWCSWYGSYPFLLTGNVTGGLPEIKLPPFSITNGSSEVTFTEMVSNMGSAVIAVPLISIMEMIAIVKSFEKGKVLDGSQEMIALGVSNIAGAFIRSMPVSGSFTRTAVNHASGVSSPLGGIFTATLILLALSFLTSLFYYIPKATLAALIITAMVFMIEYHAVITIWRTKKMDLVPLFVSFFACLFFGLERGMIIGIATNLAFILYNTARPTLSVQWTRVNGEDILIVTPTQNLLFPAAEYIREAIVNACVQKYSSCPVIILGTHVYDVDSSMAKGIKMLTEDMKTRKQPLYLWRWRDSAIKTCVGYDPSLHQYFHFDSQLISLFRNTDDAGSEHSSMEIDTGDRTVQPLTAVVPSNV